MEKETQRRGTWDTRPAIHGIAILLSVLLHVLPFPMYLLGGSFHWFDSAPPELPDHETIIPIDLMLSGGDEQPTAGSAAKTPPESTEPMSLPTTRDTSSKSALADAGAADGAVQDARIDVDAGADASHADATPQDAASTDATMDVGPQHGKGDASRRGVEGGVTDGAPRDVAVARVSVPDAARIATSVDAAVASTEAGAGGAGDAGVDAKPYRPIRDPVGLSGDAKKITPRNPNVSLLIYPERIRAHPMGNRFGQTVTKLRNWHNFFQGSGLDPVRDTDRILLAGPQLRNSSRVVAVLRYNVARQKVRAAIDSIVKRSAGHGRWLPNKPVPVALAHVDGADRYFVMLGGHVLVVVPPDGLDQALKLPRNLRFPQGGNDVVVLFLKHPANAFRDQPVKLPTSVAWMRFSLSLDEHGGGYARLDAKDKDAASAARNAPALTRVIDGALVFDYMFGKIRLLDPVTFRADGDHIRAETRVTEAQIRHLFAIISAKVEQVDGERPSAPAASK